MLLKSSHSVVIQSVEMWKTYTHKLGKAWGETKQHSLTQRFTRSLFVTHTHTHTHTQTHTLRRKYGKLHGASELCIACDDIKSGKWKAQMFFLLSSLSPYLTCRNEAECSWRMCGAQSQLTSPQLCVLWGDCMNKRLLKLISFTLC